MTPPLRFLLAALATLTVAIASRPASAQEFAILLESPVSNGVPGPGAGFIEEPLGMDVYTLEIDRPMSIYAEELSGLCGFDWSMTDPRGEPVFFDSAFCVTNPGMRVLPIAGTYTITVVGTGAATGPYSFVIWELDAPQHFEIGFEETVSDGVPAPGAGNLEEPGSVDVCTFAADAGTEVYFDELAGGCGLRWSVTSPSEVVLFTDFAMCSTDPGVQVLDESGIWTVTVNSPGGSTGTYSFRIWTLEPPQEFAISLGDVVSPGVPAAGAGVLEEPGAVDLYTLPLVAGQIVYFEELSGGCGIRWRLLDPEDTVRFSDLAMCVTDPGEIEIEITGEHLLVVEGAGGAIGSYAFSTVLVNPPQVFELAVGDVVSNGIPARGAGNIESPGSVDVYLVALDEGADVCFRELAGGCGIEWNVMTPSGETLFTDLAMCSSNPGRFSGLEAGIYLVTLSGPGGATGPPGVGLVGVVGLRDRRSGGARRARWLESEVRTFDRLQLGQCHHVVRRRTRTSDFRRRVALPLELLRGKGRAERRHLGHDDRSDGGREGRRARGVRCRNRSRNGALRGRMVPRSTLAAPSQPPVASW